MTIPSHHSSKDHGSDGANKIPSEFNIDGWKSDLHDLRIKVEVSDTFSAHALMKTCETITPVLQDVLQGVKALLKCHEPFGTVPRDYTKSSIKADHLRAVQKRIDDNKDKFLEIGKEIEAEDQKFVLEHNMPLFYESTQDKHYTINGAKISTEHSHKVLLVIAHVANHNGYIHLTKQLLERAEKIEGEAQTEYHKSSKNAEIKPELRKHLLSFEAKHKEFCCNVRKARSNFNAIPMMNNEHFDGSLEFTNVMSYNSITLSQDINSALILMQTTSTLLPWCQPSESERLVSKIHDLVLYCESAVHALVTSFSTYKPAKLMDGLSRLMPAKALTGIFSRLASELDGLLKEAKFLAIFWLTTKSQNVEIDNRHEKQLKFDAGEKEKDRASKLKAAEIKAESKTNPGNIIILDHSRTPTLDHLAAQLGLDGSEADMKRNIEYRKHFVEDGQRERTISGTTTHHLMPDTTDVVHPGHAAHRHLGL